MKIIYRADDGTDFENEEECKNHERYPDKIRKEVHIYDEDFNELSFDIVDWKERICFFKCGTEGSFHFFVNIFPYDIIYEDFEKIDLFFRDEKTNYFMTVREREKLRGVNYRKVNYRKAKEFQEKLEKGE